MQIQGLKVANIRDKGRIEFYPTLNTCRMRMKTLDKKENSWEEDLKKSGLRVT